jgi:3-oxoacyl-[acyl-carrier protein] reductase
MGDLKDKVALVTGGATGIGKGCVYALNKLGAKVILVYFQSKNETEKIVEELGNIVLRKVDVTNESEVKKLFNFVSNDFGYLDILVNNAGGNISFHKTEEYPTKDWIDTFNLNTLSVFLMCKYAIPLIRDGGKIINISSISGKTGGAPGGMAYAAAKASVDCMTKALAKELADKKINVNAVSPGVIRTRQHERFSSKEYYASLIEKIPLGRDGLPSDVANVVAFLCCSDSNYITGQIIEVNGGQYMK